MFCGPWSLLSFSLSDGSEHVAEAVESESQIPSLPVTCQCEGAHCGTTVPVHSFSTNDKQKETVAGCLFRDKTQSGDASQSCALWLKGTVRFEEERKLSHHLGGGREEEEGEGLAAREDGHKNVMSNASGGLSFTPPSLFMPVAAPTSATWPVSTLFTGLLHSVPLRIVRGREPSGGIRTCPGGRRRGRWGG